MAKNLSVTMKKYLKLAMKNNFVKIEKEFTVNNQKEIEIS